VADYQASLFPAYTQGDCAFGSEDVAWVGPHHCASCAAAVQQATTAMQRAIARGGYDAQGYTPVERRASQRRQGLTR